MKLRDTRSSEAGRPACLAGGESPWCSLHPTHEQLASPHMPPQGPEGARLEIKNTAISTVFITLRCPPGWDKHRQVRIWEPCHLPGELSFMLWWLVFSTGEKNTHSPLVCPLLTPSFIIVGLPSKGPRALCSLAPSALLEPGGDVVFTYRAGLQRWGLLFISIFIIYFVKVQLIYSVNFHCTTVI